jgi:hypothetical protein
VESIAYSLFGRWLFWLKANTEPVSTHSSAVVREALRKPESSSGGGHIGIPWNLGGVGRRGCAQYIVVKDGRRICRRPAFLVPCHDYLRSRTTTCRVARTWTGGSQDLAGAGRFESGGLRNEHDAAREVNRVVRWRTGISRGGANSRTELRNQSHEVPRLNTRLMFASGR